MLHAARSLLKTRNLNISDDADQVVSEFREQFCDTQVFFDPFAGGKFANYLFDAHKTSGLSNTPESSRYLIDEAQLFIDAAHSCINRMATAKIAKAS
jgi:sulfite reductase (ferredoxin)